MAPLAPLPPTDDDPLLITTPEGRLISCAVRQLRRHRRRPRWIFVTAIHDVGGFLIPAVYIGPVYRPGEHDDVDAIRGLACDWWKHQKEIEHLHVQYARRFSEP
jgi:hypothetical protein